MERPQERGGKTQEWEINDYGTGKQLPEVVEVFLHGLLVLHFNLIIICWFCF